MICSFDFSFVKRMPIRMITYWKQVEFSKIFFWFWFDSLCRFESPAAGPHWLHDFTTTTKLQFQSHVFCLDIVWFGSLLLLFIKMVIVRFACFSFRGCSFSSTFVIDFYMHERNLIKSTIIDFSSCVNLMVKSTATKLWLFYMNLSNFKFLILKKLKNWGTINHLGSDLDTNTKKRYINILNCRM